MTDPAARKGFERQLFGRLVPDDPYARARAWLELVHDLDPRDAITWWQLLTPEQRHELAVILACQVPPTVSRARLRRHVDRMGEPRR